MQEFWQWFIGEAGAGWIVGILGLVGGVYAWLKRERPAQIIIQELETLRLMDIHPSQQHKLDIRYKTDEFGEVKIHDLFQKQVVIYNSGTRDILEPLDLKLGAIVRPELHSTNYRKGNDLFVVIIDQVMAKQVDRDPGYPGAWSVCLQIPYLNSYQDHQQYLKCEFISNYPMELVPISKTGRGWSVSILVPKNKTTC
jgi:hypothetical protein